MPCNAVTGARYRGINVLALTMSALAFASGDPRWATYKQSADHGWQVRQGERGTTAYFFKQFEVADTRDDAQPDIEATARRIPLLRAFTLFHASQIDGIPPFTSPTDAEAPWRAPDAAETIVANSGVMVRVGGDRAYYAPLTDHVQMPPRNAFRSAEGWCSTILHELAHSTSHPSRLNRDLHNAAFGSPDYSREELRAEFSQMMVCSELGQRRCLRLLLARSASVQPQGNLPRRRRGTAHRRLSPRLSSRPRRCPAKDSSNCGRSVRARRLT
jgi:antirestriction protein ArdC